MKHFYFHNVGGEQKAQDFKHRKAEAAAHTKKLKNAQKIRPEVKCESKADN